MNANSIIFDEYAWINRLVIMITHEKNTDLEKQSKRFFNMPHVCDIKDRNLKLLHFNKNEPAVAQLQKTMRSQTGLWLLGYDGSIKRF